MAFLIGGANSAADTAYEVANSCRFNRPDSAYLNFSQGNGNRKDFTWSGWIKRSSSGLLQLIWHCNNAGHYSWLGFDSSDRLQYYSVDGSTVQGSFVSTQVFRDQSAWYHIVARFEMSNATEDNRIRFYVNGSEITVWTTKASIPSQNTDLEMNVSGHTFRIGTYANSSDFVGMYMSEISFCDGQSYAPTSFGEFNSDSPTIWQPIDISGLTFGTNGFWLDFEDSSALGNDVSGENNDFTPANLAATDQSIDSPTNNFCTLNPLLKGSYITLSEGNLVETGNTATDAGNVACTFPMPGGGKWYFELKITAVSGSYPKIAVFHDFESVPQGTYNGGSGGSNMHPSGASGNAVSTTVQYGSTTLENPTSNLTITAPANGDTIQFALDMDNGAIYVGVNGTFLNSGDPTSGASKTGKVADLTVTNQIMPMVSDYNGGATSWNFGSPNHSISSGNADDNGYGNFEYDVPTGYFALCSKNLGSDGG